MPQGLGGAQRAPGRRTCSSFARELRETGELREDLTDEDVAHLVWTTNSPEFYRLTTSRGRTPEHYVAADLADPILPGRRDRCSR